MINKDNLKNEYLKNIDMLKEISNKRDVLEEKGNNIDNKARELINSKQFEDWKKYVKETKEQTIKIEYNKKLCDIGAGLVENNLIIIKRYLLNEFLELYKNKYATKNIGEKTKEKLQNEFKEYVKNNYDIDIYPYYSMRYFNFGNEVELSLTFNDLTYYYTIRDEKLTYYLRDNRISYYYGNNIEYTDVNNINNTADNILSDYNDTIKEIKELKEKMEKLRDNNNINKTGGLSNLYINYDFKNI